MFPENFLQRTTKFPALPRVGIRVGNESQRGNPFLSCPDSPSPPFRFLLGCDSPLRAVAVRGRFSSIQATLIQQFSKSSRGIPGYGSAAAAAAAAGTTLGSKAPGREKEEEEDGGKKQNELSNIRTRG